MPRGTGRAAKRERVVVIDLESIIATDFRFPGCPQEAESAASRIHIRRLSN
jgi:coenzyme F420-reducing hydrogenase gamma subunit